MKYVNVWRYYFNMTDNIGLHCNLGSLNKETYFSSHKPLQNMFQLKLTRPHMRPLYNQVWANH